MYKNILVPLDGSELAEQVLPHVRTIATGCSVGKVTLVRVVPPLHLYGGVESRFSPEEKQEIENESIRVAREYLAGVTGQLTGGEITVEAAVLSGDVVEQLIDYASRNEVDLIVIATHGRSGVSRWAWGSVADRILRSAKVPVLMVRAQATT